MTFGKTSEAIYSFDNQCFIIRSDLFEKFLSREKRAVPKQKKGKIKATNM